MSLIIFLLLTVVVLAVGVRVLESGSKIGLALAILVAAVLGFHLVSQQAKVAQVQTIATAVATERGAKSSPQVEDDNQPAQAGDTAASLKTPATVTDAESQENRDVADEATSPPTDVAAGEHSSASEDLEIELVATPGKPIIPPRPEWVEAEPVNEGDSRAVVVSSGPQGHLGECQSALDAELERAVNQYIDEYLGQVYGDKFQASTLVNFPAKYIRDELVDDGKIYEEKIQFSFGPMYQSHAQVAFTPAFRAVLDGERVHLDKQWEQIVVAGRLTGAAIIFGLILALLAVVSGYFRLDTATRGFYTARLQFLATVAILAVIVAGVLLARNVHWM